MSKVTIALIVILCIFLVALSYVVFNPKPTTLIETLIPHTSLAKPLDTTLSFSPTEQTFQLGQTFTVAVVLHNPDAHLSLAQLELAFDPTVLTVESLTPGPFFINPLIDLQNIDPSSGRISYALHCSNSQPSAKPADCTDITTPTIAVITFSISPFTTKPDTMLSFLPKTFIRTSSGKDILQMTSNLQIPITKPAYPISSSSAIFQPGVNIIHPTKAPLNFFKPKLGN